MVVAEVGVAEVQAEVGVGVVKAEEAKLRVERCHSGGDHRQETDPPLPQVCQRPSLHSVAARRRLRLAPPPQRSMTGTSLLLEPAWPIVVIESGAPLSPRHTPSCTTRLMMRPHLAMAVVLVTIPAVIITTTLVETMAVVALPHLQQAQRHVELVEGTPTLALALALLPMMLLQRALVVSTPHPTGPLPQTTPASLRPVVCRTPPELTTLTASSNGTMGHRRRRTVCEMVLFAVVTLVCPPCPPLTPGCSVKVSRLSPVRQKTPFKSCWAESRSWRPSSSRLVSLCFPIPSEHTS